MYVGRADKLPSILSRRHRLTSACARARASFTSLLPADYPELVSAAVLPDATVAGILAFRDARGGVMAGNNRFEGHLDNMPVYGYARAALRLMDAPSGAAAQRFMLLVQGHAANYASRGTFSASEQLAIFGDAQGAWRDYLWS